MKHSSLAKLVWTGCWLILACGLDANVAARQTASSLLRPNATTERRVALVIGNSDYGKQHLATTRRDAREVATTLRELGFEVLTGENVTPAEWRQLLSKFAERTRQSDVGLFYFAGIGAQLNNRNFLLPTRANFKNTAQLQTTSIKLDEVLAAVSARSNLLLLDASRVNSLLRAKPPGLASLSAPANTLIAFSTQPGTTTLDPKGQSHSSYTASLLQHLRTRGLSLTTLFDRVRAEVASATKKRQMPWESSGLRGEFSLNPAPKAVAVVTAPENNEIAAWQAIAQSTDLKDFQAYLAKYPQGIYADSARVKLQQLTGKEEPKTSDGETTSVPLPLPEVFTAPPQTLPSEPEAKAKPENVVAPPSSLPGNSSVTSKMQVKVEQLFYDACYIKKNEPVCCQLAVELISRFSNTIYGMEARKRTRDCTLTSVWHAFQTALNDYYAGAPDSAKLEKLFSTGEAFLRLMPDHPDVVAQMAMAGSQAALAEIYGNRHKVKSYAEKALKVFEPTRPPSLEIMDQQRWTQFRDLVLASQNQYLGWFYSLADNIVDENRALNYLAKAMQVKATSGIGWRDPTNYWLRATIYNREYARLSKQHTALSAEQKESDFGKTLLAQINQVVDKLIVEYARTVAIANRPQYKPYQDAARAELQTLWKGLHGSLTGMEEFIKRYEKDPSAA